MVLASKEWEQKYPKVKLMALTRVGSDHCPLLLDDGNGNNQFKKGFRFEIAWLSQREFKRSLVERCPARRDERVQDFLEKGEKKNRDNLVKVWELT
jgi:hypothetical protein